MLTNEEEQIINTEYEKHKYDNICPHTTNPLQLKSLCRRCRVEAEEWALTKAYPIKDKQGNRYRNIGAYIDLDT